MCFHDPDNEKLKKKIVSSIVLITYLQYTAIFWNKQIFVVDMICHLNNNCTNYSIWHLNT